MSIIEKAVNALGKEKAVERKKTVEASVDSQSSEADSGNTVQRAEDSQPAPNQSTAVELQNETDKSLRYQCTAVKHYGHCKNSLQGIAESGYVDA